MAKSLNKVQLIGNLGRDPEVRYMGDGGCVASMSIACTDSWVDKNTGEKKEKTEWINLTAFRKLAEICAQHLKKGAKIYVEGKFTTEKWQDKNGNDRYTSKIIMNNMLMLSGIPHNDGQGGGYQQPAQQPAQQSAPAMSGQPVQGGDYDDEIPF